MKSLGLAAVIAAVVSFGPSEVRADSNLCFESYQKIEASYQVFGSVLEKPWAAWQWCDEVIELDNVRNVYITHAGGLVVEPVVREPEYLNPLRLAICARWTSLNEWRLGSGKLAMPVNWVVIPSAEALLVAANKADPPSEEGDTLYCR